MSGEERWASLSKHGLYERAQRKQVRAIDDVEGRAHRWAPTGVLTAASASGTGCHTTAVAGDRRRLDAATLDAAASPRWRERGAST